MIVGDPTSFAIESSITLAYSSKSQRALGYFLIYIRGRQHGVRKPDASLLACSLEEVRDRIARRATHCFPALSDINGAMIADAFLDARYSGQPRDGYFGLSRSAFDAAMHARHIQWAPDGDAAFDDGSHVLQFDVENRVRLIGLQNSANPIEVAGSVTEHWLDGDLFYGTLAQWSKAFASEWSRRLP